MKIKKENLNEIKLKKDKNISIFNIDIFLKENEKKEHNINDIIQDIIFYLKDKNDIEYIKNYFKNYEYFKIKNIHIISNNKEIIILRDNKEKLFFINSHIKYLLENKKEDENFIDIENRLNEIYIYKNYIIYDYIKYDYK